MEENSMSTIMNENDAYGMYQGGGKQTSGNKRISKKKNNEENNMYPGIKLLRNIRRTKRKFWKDSNIKYIYVIGKVGGLVIIWNPIIVSSQIIFYSYDKSIII